MTEFVNITIDGKRFSMTKEEAGFLAEHLRTALVNPHASLCYSHTPRGAGGLFISVERGSAMLRGGASNPAAEHLTDC